MKKALAISALVIVGLVILILLAPILLVTVGLWDVPHSSAPFDEAHDRAVTTFVKSEGFGISRFRKSGLWNEHSVEYQGADYFPFKIRLIGTTREFGARLFTDSRPPRKDRISESPTRDLTPHELIAIERLRTRQTRREELEPEDAADPDDEEKRVIAPIFASDDCLKCHQASVGEMLGAFEYTLMLQSRPPQAEPGDSNPH